MGMVTVNRLKEMPNGLQLNFDRWLNFEQWVVNEGDFQFIITNDKSRFKLNFESANGPLVMRDPFSGNIYLGIAEPEGMLIQYPCGTKHFIKYDKD